MSRAAAHTGATCPYVIPETRRAWKAGWRDERRNLKEQFGPASLAGEGERE